MPRNRVQELEETVEELQGTIDGLTVELVDINKRLQAIESKLDDETPTTVDTNGHQEDESPVESDGSDIIIC